MERESANTRERVKQPKFAAAVIGVMLFLAVLADVALPLAAPDQLAEAPEITFTAALVTGFVLAFHLFPRRDALLLVAVSFVVTVAVENFGIATGVPFGPFYHTLPGPYIGHVPVVAGFAYLPFTAIGWAYADLVMPDARGLGKCGAVLHTLIASLVGAAMEALYDPVGCLLLHRWVYPEGGAYFGTPLTNALGWTLTLAVGIVAFRLLVLRGRLSRYAEAPTLPQLELCALMALSVLPSCICAFAFPETLAVDPSGVTWSTTALFGTVATLGFLTMLPCATAGAYCYLRGKR